MRLGNLTANEGKTLGQIAYEAFTERRQLQGTGEVYSPWKDVPTDWADAWIVAATAAYIHGRMEGDGIENGPTEQ